MKYVLTFSLSAVLLGTAIASSGHPVDASSIVAILVASCLPVWVVREYWNEPRSAIVPRRAPVSRPIARIKPLRQPFRAPALEPRLPSPDVLVANALER